MDANKSPGDTLKSPATTPRVVTPDTTSNNNKGTDERESAESSMPKKDKVRNWGKKDVARWLEKRGLVKFVPLFLKNGVVGSDLAESKLGFLYDEEVMVEDREQLLAEIYMLLHPDSPRLTRRQTPSPALRRPLSVKDQEKFEAAMQVARSPTSRSSSPALILIGQSRGRSPVASSLSRDQLTPSAAKQRSRSESGVDTGGSQPTTPPSPMRKYLKRKSTPAVHDYLQRGVVQGVSLFDTLHNQGRVCLHCVQVHRSPTQEKFGFSYQTLPDSCLIVTSVQSPDCPLQPGDRIIEVNGMVLSHQSRGAHKGGSLDLILGKAASLDIVLVRAFAENADSPRRASEQVLLQEQVVMAEVRWQSLRQTLLTLQQKEFDPVSAIAKTPVDEMKDIRSRVSIEMEVDQLQKDTKEQAEKLRNLEATLKAKELELEETQRQRDLALQKLRNNVPARNRSSSTDSYLHKGDKGVDVHTQFYEEHLKSLESPVKTKEDVLSILRELVRASRQQTSYLDRLTSVVLRRAPWMLDEIETEEDLSCLPSPASSSSIEDGFASSSILRTRNVEGNTDDSGGFDTNDEVGPVILV